MSQKLVSIIMPAYNASNYIIESIDSVLDQTYQNWELLISDNNSVDNTAEIIKSYLKKDSRIKYINSSDHQGAGYARNVAIENANGSYIAFLDSDDRWLPEKLEKHIKFMQDEDLELSYTSYKTFGESNGIVENHKEVDYAKLLHHNVIGCSTAIYNLDKLGKKYYMSTLRIAEDWCLWCNILKDSSKPAKMLSEPLTLYRIDENSLSANKLKCAYYHYLALREEMKIPLVKSLYLFACYALVNIKKMHSKRILLRMLGVRTEVEANKNFMKRIIHSLIFRLKTNLIGKLAYAIVRFVIMSFRSLLKVINGKKFNKMLDLNAANLKKINLKDFDLSEKKYVFTESQIDDRYAQIKTALGSTLVTSIEDADYALIWGRGFKYVSYKTLKDAIKYNKPVFIAEDGFLRSVDLGVNGEVALSIHVDLAGGIYYDARIPSIIENTLNDKNYKLNSQEKELANKAMDEIKSSALSKYNLTMPQDDIKIGEAGKKKVLVLDQRYGDQSIEASLSNPQRFVEMLDAAIKENPDADIILKVHPDVISGGLKGHYKDLDKRDDIILLTENYNPVSLLQSIDKVYTVSSGMGFEALICGKEVVCFGVPFYSNWGLTDDRIKLDRRKANRTLQEVFYAGYIKYNAYYNDYTKQRTDIMSVIKRLTEKRDIELSK